ncbi:hypothetical protein MKX01_035126 [Papaver californicum]|nr:hypothetical protein MKX01_035126 [Papaver californicum]
MIGVATVPMVPPDGHKWIFLLLHFSHQVTTSKERQRQGDIKHSLSRSSFVLVIHQPAIVLCYIDVLIMIKQSKDFCSLPVNMVEIRQWCYIFPSLLPLT